MKRKAVQEEDPADEGIMLFASRPARGVSGAEGPSHNLPDTGTGIEKVLSNEMDALAEEHPAEEDVGSGASSEEQDLEADREAASGGSLSEGGDGEEQDEPPTKRSRVDKKGSTEVAKQKGVLYMSRVPPHMKPLKLRHMLSKHGEVGRLYLAPEDPSLRKKRKKFKGNTGKNFSEGWVEFNDKAVAKRVAASLNGNTMGGKKRSAYHYDIWCLKYLSKFKWEHLTEEIAYQNAVREQKLANELSAAKRERDFYMTRVDRAKAEEAKEKRRKAKTEAEGGAKAMDQSQATSAAGAGAKATEKSQLASAAGAGGKVGPKVMRTYGQRKSKPEPGQEGAPGLSAELLSLIAGKKE